jgi:hypothetical protein
MPDYVLVEVAGIEPASKEPTKITSTSVVILSLSFGLWRQVDPFHFSYTGCLYSLHPVKRGLSSLLLLTGEGVQDCYLPFTPHTPPLGGI